MFFLFFFKKNFFFSIVRVFRDLFASEKQYINDLLVVVEEYLLPLRRAQQGGAPGAQKFSRQKLLPAQTLAAIFSSVEVILDAHQSLYCDLLRIRSGSEWPFLCNIGDALLKAAPDFACYRLYVEGTPHDGARDFHFCKNFPLFYLV